MYSVLEAEIEGRKHQIENFLQDIKAAPAQALASNANVQWMSYKGVYHNFQVRH
jgi:acylphosphatase